MLGADGTLVAIRHLDAHGLVTHTVPAHIRHCDCRSRKRRTDTRPFVRGHIRRRGRELYRRREIRAVLTNARGTGDIRFRQGIYCDGHLLRTLAVRDIVRHQQRDGTCTLIRPTGAYLMRALSRENLCTLIRGVP